MEIAKDDEVKDRSAGNEFLVKDEVIVKEDETEDEETRNRAVMGK